MRRHCLSLIATCILAACGAATPSDAPNRYVLTVDSSGHYPVMQSSGSPPVWTSTLLATVGAADDSASELGRVRSVLLSPAGALFVVDEGYTRLVKFDSAGAFVAQWGRKGSGPGEYLSPYSIAWLGDSLALLDPNNSRIALYDATGRWIRQWTVQRITGGEQVRLFRTARDAFWVYATHPNGNRMETVFIRYTSNGPTDTLLWVRQAPGLIESAVCETPDKALHFYQAPYSANLLVIPSPTGERAVALTSTYHVALLNPAGDTTRVLERDVQAVPVSDAEWDDGLTDWNSFRSKYPSATCDRGSFTRTKTKPIVERVFYDDVGQLWVEVHEVNGRSYDVFSPEGRLVGSVTGLPESGGVEPSVVGNRMAIVVPDENGVHTVRVYRFGVPKP